MVSSASEGAVTNPAAPRHPGRPTTDAPTGPVIAPEA
jgi:hypothetical protein